MEIEMSENIRGESVVVRTIDDRPVLRRVWESTTKLIYICSDKQFEMMESGKESPPPIGFPSNDVFCYDEISKEALSRNDLIDWTKLNPFTSSRQMG
ncbi:MAG: hypothetical protein NTY41_13675 [Proteobacteria bacterium]|nr:hypothetical protein [Pseudomonadota bacterium]